MKKIFLTVILCLCLVVGTMGLAACEKDKGYQITNLLEDYQAIADECRSVEYNQTSKRLQFNYSSFVNAKNEPYLNTVIGNLAYPYQHVNDYNEILYNLMKFVNENIVVVSTESFADTSKSLRNKVHSNLNNLKSAFVQTDIQVQEFARNINTNSSRDEANKDAALKSKEYLQTFKHLLDSYNSLYEAAFELNITFSKIYYAKTEGNFQNVNLSETLEAFAVKNDKSQSVKDTLNTSLSHFIAGLGNRVNVSIAGLSYVFYQKYIQTGELSQKLITEQGNAFPDMGENYNYYKQKVQQITQSIVNQDMASLSDDVKIQLGQFSIRLYNVWARLENDFEKFYNAHSNIDSSIVKGDFDKSNYETYCLEILEDYFNLIEQNVDVLVDLFNAEIV